jgi:hypothetical protein
MCHLNCICPSISDTSNAQLDAMSSQGLIDYEYRLVSQRNCKYPGMVSQEKERCVQRRAIRALQNDAIALHWKLNLSLSEKPASTVCKNKI